MRWSRKIVSIISLVVLIAGCSTTYTQEDQEKLAQLYYSGEVEKAAILATKISEDLAGQDDERALIWHLEAGSVNLDAGRYPEAIAALNRAEKTIYLFDGWGVSLYHLPNPAVYTGTRTDRLMLHLLKGFYYLSQNSLEDALVEIRRLRVEQFRYILQEVDQEVFAYEKENSGKVVDPLYMAQIFQDSMTKSIFDQLDVNDAYTEYQQRRRPQLPLFCNPIAFYLSCLGYCFDREYQDAVVDMRYLVLLDLKNTLYQEDYAALCRALGDPVPREVAHAAKRPVPDDQVVCIFWASGKPDGWGLVTKTYELDGCVPTDWQLSYPEYTSEKTSPFSAGWRNEPRRTASKLADLSEVMRDEYWQQDFPRLLAHAKRSTIQMTVSHDAALVALAAASAIPETTIQLTAMASAGVAVAATSRAYVNNAEWRRWITLPRHYYAMHLPLPPEPGKRVLQITPPRTSACQEKLTLQFSPDTNRAIVYIRELPTGQLLVKNWESNE